MRGGYQSAMENFSGNSLTDKEEFLIARELHQQGRLSDASLIYQRILNRNPNHTDTLNLYGVLMQQQGKLEEAEELLRRTISIDGFFVKSLSNLGGVLLNLKRANEAIVFLTRAIEIDPDFITPLYNRGNAFLELRMFDEAIRDFERIIAVHPDDFEAQNNRASAFFQMGALEQAILGFEKVLKINSEYAEAYLNLGITYDKLGLKKEALKNYNLAIRYKINKAAAYLNRGVILHESSEFTAALADFKRAIELEPDYAEAYSNQGNVLRDLKHLDEALDSHHRATQLKPAYAEAYLNLANTLVDLKRFEEAFDSYDRAIHLKPDYVNANWSKAGLLLLNGKMRDGWQLHEWRWKIEQQKEAIRKFSKPLWLGKEELSGKTILLYAEQGLGDTIQFCRYAALVKARGARVILEVPQPLITLLQGLLGVDILLDGRQPLPHFDYYCPLLSLPLAFDTELETIPNALHYLTVDQVLRNEWALKLGKKIKPRIGVTWSGNPSHKNDHNRSLSLKILLQYLSNDCEYFSLQKEIRDQDREMLQKSTIRHFGDQMTDFAETAALCDLMDLVISVDTSVAHLAGAMGKPTWILLPHIPDWRWLLGREDSPWYPSVRLFRQDRVGDWDGVLQNMKVALSKKFHASESAL